MKDLKKKLATMNLLILSIGIKLLLGLSVFEQLSIYLGHNLSQISMRYSHHWYVLIPAKIRLYGSGKPRKFPTFIHRAFRSWKNRYAFQIQNTCV